MHREVILFRFLTRHYSEDLSSSFSQWHICGWVPGWTQWTEQLFMALALCANSRWFSYYVNDWKSDNETLALFCSFINNCSMEWVTWSTNLMRKDRRFYCWYRVMLLHRMMYIELVLGGMTTNLYHSIFLNYTGFTVYKTVLFFSCMTRC